MKYSDLLSNAVKESKLSLAEISMRCKRHGVFMDRSYLSKLCNGKHQPGSDKLNKVLAEVLSPVSSITCESLRLAAYKENIPEDIQKALVEEALDAMRYSECAQ